MKAQWMACLTAHKTAEVMASSMAQLMDAMMVLKTELAMVCWTVSAWAPMTELLKETTKEYY